MEQTEIRNAIITSAVLDTCDRGLLTAWLHLDYDGSGQGFGGYALYLPKSYKHHTNKGNFAGHFIFRCMEIVGVEVWDKLKGKALRVKCNRGKIEAIGHIVKDDWFNPSDDFKNMEDAQPCVSLDKRIIINSKNLYQYLNECLDRIDHNIESDYIMHFERNSISIPAIMESCIYCETGNLVLDFKFEYKRLFRLCKILKYFEEQPIALVFDNDCVKISCAVI